VRVIRGRGPGAHYYRVLAVASFCEPPRPIAREELETLYDQLKELEGRLKKVPAAEEERKPSEEAPCGFTSIEYSDWSDPALVPIDAAPDWLENAARPYAPSTWLAVARAAARFCAARGDTMALLALPGHARDDEALALQTELLSPTGPSIPVGPTHTSLPLDARERAAWGYTALYHPWLTGFGPTGALAATPPLGAVAGVFAARAVERGAWVAAANHTLAGVVALAPPIPESRRKEFLDRQINLLRSEPQGFLALSQDTLALDIEPESVAVRPINVRRLLILLRRLVLRLGEVFVFEPNGENLRLRVRHSFEAVLSQMQARGAFAGRTAADSYRVEFGDDKNPPSTADSGRLIVQLKVAPSRPLAFLTIRLVQTGDRSRVVEVL
jgi:hypothetical protein